VFAIEVPETISFPRAYTAGLPLPLFDPAREGALAYVAVARRLYTPPEPQRTPEPAAALAAEAEAVAAESAGYGDAAPAPTGARVEGNDFTV
jgi:hypothetical protein